MKDDADLSVALQAATRAGATHVEARHVAKEREWLAFKDAQLQKGTRSLDEGVGIRVIHEGRWGYAATSKLDPESLKAAAKAAITAAGATSQKSAADFELPPPVTGSYRTPMQQDPFGISHREKVGSMEAIHHVLKADPRIRTARGNLICQRAQTRLWTAHGTRIEQEVVLCGGGAQVVAMDGDEVQARSFPKAMEGNILQGGWEVMSQLNIAGQAEQMREEAIALCSADELPMGKKTVILDGAQLSLQIHESVGHPTELDRVQGEEISLAGASFLLPHHMDQLRFGAPGVNLTADATTPGGPGTFGFDDEGTPAAATPLVKDGQFVGYLSGRESAARLGRPSAGCLRAESWDRQPIVRMINVNLEPGQGSLDQMISGIDDGVLLSVNRSWSIDDLRLNFQFACELAYEIKGGKKTGRIFKNPVYFGVTPQFWNGCSAICGPEEWRMWGWFFCGKGDPIQSMYVGHGCAPARFDGVQVGGSRGAQQEQAA